jgi:FlaA1/EpsC-like NDP-sugar epimerase
MSLVIIDSFIILTAIFTSYFILFLTREAFTSAIIISSIVLLISHHLFAYSYKLYKRAWEYASVGELLSIIKASTLAILVTAFFQSVFLQDIYSRTLVITWMMHILLIGSSRFSWRLYRDTYISRRVHKNRALIIGAGAAGTMVARQLKQSRDAVLYPVAFIDDDKRKHPLEVMGIPVLGGIDKIAETVDRYNIENIIIAIPSLNKKALNNIYLECTKTKAQTKIIPMLEDIMLGKVSVSEFRDVQVEDLLGRDAVELDIENVEEYLKNKVVLVTGAGGSIGSEVCRQISRFKPSQVILLGHGENSIHSIELELKDSYGRKIEYITEIADVQDQSKIVEIMSQYSPNVVFHAAAHKHVPLMERNPEEAVKNNVIGTKNVAEAANLCGVQSFVMVSTDKAVNPTSVMGATKRIAEMIIQSMDAISNTRFVVVRFGNVLGSRGSVIPLFKEQIKKGGPVTVTHPDMVRYFMTIPEASKLVLQAGALARGGEIFVLDMGDPVKIVDLAKNLIKLSGYTEDEIKIKFTGVRSGEKLYEELLNENEVHEQQVFPKIYIGKSHNLKLDLVLKLIQEFRELNNVELRNRLLDTTNEGVKEHGPMAVGK